MTKAQRKAFDRMRAGLARWRRSKGLRKSKGKRRRRRASAPATAVVVYKRGGGMAKRTKRARRSGGGGRRGFLSGGGPVGALLPPAAAATAGFVLPDLLISRLERSSGKALEPGAAAMVKVGVGVAAVLFGRRFVGSKVATSFAVGCIASAAAPWVRSRVGLSGVGNPSPTGLFPSASGQYVATADGSQVRLAV